VSLFQARELSLRSRAAFNHVTEVIFDFEYGLNDVTLDDFRGALLLAAQAAERDAEDVRRTIEGDDVLEKAAAESSR